ncbi:hypothetical protein DD574_06290 [Klebsiella pneumoniae]|nr:hypothetical protein DD574_06290 [Klebsiella pneumoniae]
MMSLWDALRMNMMISYQELVRTFPKQNVKYIFTNQDPVQMMNFIGYLSLVDTTKDKKKMDMVRKCTPWKPECSQQFVDVMEGFDSIMYKYEGEFKNYIELK